MEETNLLSKVAEIQLSYHPKIKAEDRPKVSQSEQVYKLLMQNWDLSLIELQEHFKLVLLNRGNRVIGIVEISRGGISETVVDVKMVFAVALKSCATAMVLAHNHPSGNLTPSKSDIDLTERIWMVGKLLGIKVWDHLIIGTDGYTSFVDRDLMDF